MSTETTTNVSPFRPQLTTTIEAFIQPIEGGGFSISCAALGITLEAPTRDEAIQRFNDWLQSHWKEGTELITFELPVREHPLAKYFGITKGDPMMAEWRKAVQDYRRMVDEEEAARTGE